MWQQAGRKRPRDPPADHRVALELARCGAIAPPDAPPSSPTGVSAEPVAIGKVTTTAGSGIPGYRDDTVDVAQFNDPFDVAVRGDGKLLVPDYFNDALRLVAPAGVTTFAGGQKGSADGVGNAARFNVPKGVVLDSAGNAYVTDIGNCAVRKVSPDAVVSTLPTKGICPERIAIDALGHLFVTADTPQIWRLDAVGTLSLLAGSPVPGYADGKGSSAQFKTPIGIACDAQGNVYVGDEGDNRIRRITPAGDVTTLAGSGDPGFIDGIGVVARFNGPDGLATDTQGNLYVADVFNHSIRRVSPDGVVTTIAGTGTPGRADGMGRFAMFKAPIGLGLDALGDIYVADASNNLIRKISASGTGTLLVKWTAPSANPPITGYVVGAVAAGHPDKTCSTLDTSCALRDLASGVTYRVTVTASNARGAGLPSVPVLAVPN